MTIIYYSSEQHTATNLVDSFIYLKVSCDYYTLRQGLNKIVRGSDFIPTTTTTTTMTLFTYYTYYTVQRTFHVGCEQQKHPQEIRAGCYLNPLSSC